ncbi:cadmium carbonic anhydrase [Sagittula sp. M10.9X]|uniref:Cadmium carbonic anhydrase n=2 Tax=Sagittula salina TaxID=2820268 RepID=A0A940MNP0_9RHOB|nr:cadmium carbonic anhydrase [Sagittula salina]
MLAAQPLQPLMAAESGATPPGAPGGTCKGYGPQTPRDLNSTIGINQRTFAMAPPATQMSLCNIHTHTNAEHRGPGFTISGGPGENGGWKCNETPNLTHEELEDPFLGHNAFHGVKPGDTIEVHWVHTSCDITPGEGLGSCLSDACANPQLRVEAQIFLVVNDPTALNFMDFDYGGEINGRHQAKAIPTGTGRPIQFLGSTTGPKYTERVCSPLQVTWAVRPNCARLDVHSLNEWAQSRNIFNETHSHGVRQIVTKPELLAPIQ